MVPVSQSSVEDLRDIRDSRDRPICLSPGAPPAHIHVPGQIGPERVCSGRAKSTVGSPVPLLVSSPDAGPHSPQQAEGHIGEDDIGRSVLERCSEAADSSGTDLRVAATPTAGDRPTDHRLDRTPGQEPGVSTFSSMVTMREATGFNLPAATSSTLENSWRGSTRWQYQSIRKLWNHWCSDQLLDSTSISVSKLLGISSVPRTS